MSLRKQVRSKVYMDEIFNTLELGERPRYGRQEFAELGEEIDKKYIGGVGTADAIDNTIGNIIIEEPEPDEPEPDEPEPPFLGFGSPGYTVVGGMPAGYNPTLVNTSYYFIWTIALVTGTENGVEDLTGVRSLYDGSDPEPTNLVGDGEYVVDLTETLGGWIYFSIVNNIFEAIELLEVNLNA
jgi:hypothetical protein